MHLHQCISYGGSMNQLKDEWNMKIGVMVIPPEDDAMGFYSEDGG